MVVGHKLRYMDLFAISNTGFCMEFQRASVVVSCPGADFRGWDQIFGPGVNIWARGPFWGKNRVPKKVML